MTATAFVVHRPWCCDSNAVQCAHGHMLTLYKSQYRGDLRDIVGHAFLQCKTCQPVSYFLAIFTREPSPIVFCYPLAKDSYDEWVARTGNTPPTSELLHALRDPDGQSHHPSFRPPL